MPTSLNCLSLMTPSPVSERFALDRKEALREKGFRMLIYSASAKKLAGGVVQLVRTSACHAEGREFESRRSRHYNAVPVTAFFLFGEYQTR